MRHDHQDPHRTPLQCGTRLRGADVLSVMQPSLLRLGCHGPAWREWIANRACLIAHELRAGTTSLSTLQTHGKSQYRGDVTTERQEILAHLTEHVGIERRGLGPLFNSQPLLTKLPRRVVFLGTNPFWLCSLVHEYSLCATS